jgi:hypothetical protein
MKRYHLAIVENRGWADKIVGWAGSGRSATSLDPLFRKPYFLIGEQRNWPEGPLIVRCLFLVIALRFESYRQGQIPEARPPIPTFADDADLSGEFVPKQKSRIILVHKYPTRSPTCTFGRRTEMIEHDLMPLHKSERLSSTRAADAHHLGIEGYGASSGGGRHDNAGRSNPSRGSFDEVRQREPARSS